MWRNSFTVDSNGRPASRRISFRRAISRSRPSSGGANSQRRNLGRQGRELHRIGQGSVNTVRTQRNCRRSRRRSGGEQAAAVDAQWEISSGHNALLSNEGLARPLDCRFLGHIPLRENHRAAGSRLVKVPAFVLMQEMKMGRGLKQIKDYSALTLLLRRLIQPPIIGASAHPVWTQIHARPAQAARMCWPSK
jgi:hypothetical protein